MKPNNDPLNPCLICNGIKIHYYFSIHKKFRLEQCSDCGLIRLNPQPLDQELAKIYNANYFISIENNRTHTSQLKLDTADYYLNLLQSYNQRPLAGHLLEIGCGHGDFLLRAAAKGLSVTGVEYSEHAANIAANKIGPNGRIFFGEIDNLLNANEKFDYIIFTDVLEHMRHPRNFLRTVHRLLRNDHGIVAIAIPSLDSLSARLLKKKWMEFKPEHLWYFSTITLRQLLYSENFGKIKSSLAKKTLSFEYIAQHFAHYPVQPFSSIINIVKPFLPRYIRQFPFRIAASGIMMLAEKHNNNLIKKLSVVMAVYNEENTVRKTIECVLAQRITLVEIELIIIESNSTDHTQHIVREYENHDRVKIIWQDKPYGKGNAIRAGLKHVEGDLILIQDADDEYDVKDYEMLIRPLILGEAAFVLGTRHQGRICNMRKFNNQYFTSHIMNFGHWCFTLLINILYGLHLKDPFTMYKVFRADCLYELEFECNHFDFDCELLIKLVRKGYKPLEIPVNYHSRSFREGKKIKIFKDPWTWLRAIIKYRLKRI